MTYRLNEYLLVPIHSDAYKPHVKTYEGKGQSIEYNIGSWMGVCDEKMLPDGEWQFICKGTEVDEVMAGEMVEDFEAYLTANPLTADRIVVLKEV